MTGSQPRRDKGRVGRSDMVSGGITLKQLFNCSQDQSSAELGGTLLELPTLMRQMMRLSWG